ncbi:MAG TPA: MaoC family dehydratase N-terminal domain-containing protein [Ramlibacter sp.]|nr:MaoC family dehydratase N-terminal domain-containing protein [Ramlibacter sp.]
MNPSTTPDRNLVARSLGDEALAEARSLLGMPIRVEQWNHEASRDVIRHYAWGIGDDNPLWNDPAYAAKTRWGGIIAPPTFFFGIFDAVVAPGLEDIQWYYSGIDAEFLQPMRRNDEITAAAAYVDVKPLQGKRVKNMLVQTGEVTYSNQKGEVCTRVLSHTYRVARSGASDGLSYEPRPKHEYTQEQLDEIMFAQVNEQVRGAQPLYWDDVQVGASLPGTVRGPINQMDMTTYYAGAPGTSGYKSTKLKWKYTHWARTAPEKLPNNYDKCYYGAKVLPSIGHQDAAVAVKDLGMPGPYDNGPQRCGMLATAVTNWMGDDGWLRTYGTRIRLPVIFGDTTYCKGRVKDKRLEGGKGVVELELWTENQLGETTMTGSGTVELPRRS